MRRGKTRAAFLQRARSCSHGRSITNGGLPFTTSLRKLEGEVPTNSRKAPFSRRLRSVKAFDTNALQLDRDFVGCLTRSLPLARRPSAPFWETLIYCAHSSYAAGSPRRCASTSPAKWSEPVTKIGFGFERASANASSTDEVME